MKVLLILIQAFFIQSAFANEIKTHGIGVVNSCSSSLVKLKSMSQSQKALVVTNGHCLLLNLNYNRQLAYPYPDEYLQDIRDPNFLAKTIIRIHSPDGTIELTPKALLFATMTGTDIAIFELTESYADLKNKYNIEPLLIAPTDLPLKSTVQIQSGYYNRVFNCAIRNYVNLVEGPFHTKQAIQLSKECDIYPGVSGSPIVEKSSGFVVGLANTHTSGEGALCAFNNPCFVLNMGEVQYKQPPEGTSFGVRLTPLNNCYDQTIHKLNFNKKDCLLIPTEQGIKPSQSKTVFSENEMNYRLERFKIFATEKLKSKNMKLKISKDFDWYMHLGSSGLENNEFSIMVGSQVFQTENLTGDGFDLILCHELGHLLGSAPKKKNELNSSGDWASGEGESDYFAGSCVTQLWNQEYPVQFNIYDWDVGVSDCQLLPNYFQMKLCQRSKNAALSFFKILYSQYGRFSPTEKSEPSLSKKDLTEVTRTELNYPQTTQCRLDSSMAGIFYNQRPSCWYKEGAHE